MDRNNSNTTPDEPTQEWAAFRGMPAKLTKLLDNESDRGAILIIGAYLDEILALIIRSACTTSKIAEAILDYRQPAGDFSSRITMCEAFGLIDSEEAQALGLIRKMRNQAAHFDKKKGRGFDVLFDSEATADQVVSLLKLFRSNCSSRKPSAIRAGFTTASRLLAVRLYLRGLTTKRAQFLMTSREQADLIRKQVEGTKYGLHLKQIEVAIKKGNLEPLRQTLQRLSEAFKPQNPETTATAPVAAASTTSSSAKRARKARKSTPTRIAKTRKKR